MNVYFVSIKKYFLGLVARVINIFVCVKTKHWVFASDFGNQYRESPKYLFEYMIKEHPDFCCTYIVANKDTYKEIAEKGYPVVMNFSLKGILTIAKAEKIFTSQTPHDMFYAYKKKGRKFYYLNHGQSLKKQMNALSSDYKKLVGQSGIIPYLKGVFHKLICNNFSVADSEFVSANSVFFIPFLKASYGESMKIKILGMPRNDALFNDEEMRKERWIEGLNGKFIITYMPTHRKYGKGALAPVPFANRQDIQDWLRQNNCVLLMKQHPNMIPKNKETHDTDVIKDITKLALDPQVIIYHSDVLVSDYSSVWLDYLLLRRPLITYLYDDFEKNDAGLNIDIKKDSPGHLCFDEDNLFVTLKKIKSNYDEMRPSEEIIEKFYLDADGNSSKRYFHELVQ